MLLYDFPDAYDLFFTKDFLTECSEFYKKIFSGKKINSVLDCAVGTGLMTIPMAKLGYNVSGSDINKNMIKRAKQNFAKSDLIPNLNVCNFLNLSENFSFEYDMVMCTGNSIAHVKNEDLIKALSEMSKVIKTGGYLYIDSRNWDFILEKRQRFYLFNPIIRDKGRVNCIQVWDYNRDDSMTFNTLMFEEIENRIVSKRQFYVIYYPFQLSFLIDIIKTLKFDNIQLFKLGDPNHQDIKNINWYSILAQKTYISE